MWFTVVSIVRQSHLNLSGPPIFFSTNGVPPQFEMSSDATVDQPLYKYFSVVLISSNLFLHAIF